MAHVRNNLYVGNLGAAGDQELGDLLARFGVVRYAAVAQGDSPTPDGRFGVVEMQAKDDAEAAIEALNGSEFGGRVLAVRWASPSEQTACGHPAMFGTMNVSNGNDAVAAPQAEAPGRPGSELGMPLTG